MEPMIRDVKHCFELIQRVVKGREDYRYQYPFSGQCYYTNGTDECDCLVGHVLDAAGFPFDQIVALDHASLGGNPIGFSWSQLSNYPAGEPFMDLPRDVIDILWEVQQMQDEGMTWGDVVRNAKRMWNDR